jgi:hypothetical protein
MELIPNGNLTEIAYEDLIQEPINELERIYNELGIQDFEENKEKFKEYLKSNEEYKVNNYTFSKDDKIAIYYELKQIIDKYGYEKPSSLEDKN